MKGMYMCRLHISIEPTYQLCINYWECTLRTNRIIWITKATTSAMKAIYPRFKGMKKIVKTNVCSLS